MINYLTSQIDFVKNKEENFLNSKIDETYIIILNDTEVCYGIDNSCNIEYCKKNNIKYIHQSKLNKGGCIVGVKGNIFIDVKRKIKDGKCISDKFSKSLAKYFESKGLQSIRTDNNDILIDDYKVASGCESTIGEFQYMGYQISMFQDIELIKNVCNKEMIKIPKGLNDYGLTTNDIKEFIEDYWSKN